MDRRGVLTSYHTAVGAVERPWRPALAWRFPRRRRVKDEQRQALDFGVAGVDQRHPYLVRWQLAERDAQFGPVTGNVAAGDNPPVRSRRHCHHPASLPVRRPLARRF